MFLAVHRPGVAATFRRDLKTEVWIGDDVDPRRGGRAAGTQHRHIFPTTVGEAANAVKIFKADLWTRHLQFRHRRTTFDSGSQHRRRERNALKLVGDAAASSDHDDAGDRQQQGARRGRDQIGAEHENVSRRALVAELWPRLTRPHERFQSGLKILNIRYGALIEDHQIHRQTLHPPILHRLERFTRDAEVIDVGNPHQDDRQIARYPQTPEFGLTSAAAFDDIRSRPQRGRREDGVAGQALKLFRRSAVDAQMVQLHLGLGPSQRGGALESAGIVVLVDQAQHVIARCGHHGPKIDARRCARADLQAATQGEDWIEHGAGSAGQGAAIDCGDRGADAAATTDEPRAIGLEFTLAHRDAVDDGEMGRPDLRLVGRTLPSVRQ